MSKAEHRVFFWFCAVVILTALLVAVTVAKADDGSLTGNGPTDETAYNIDWIEGEVEVYPDIEWSACTSLQECSFVATQACWSHRVEVEALSFDSTSSKNACSWICGNDRHGRVDCKASGTVQKPRCPASWCEPDYVGPRHPCCDAPDDDDAAKGIEWLLPGGWR